MVWYLHCCVHANETWPNLAPNKGITPYGEIAQLMNMSDILSLNFKIKLVLKTLQRLQVNH